MPTFHSLPALSLYIHIPWCEKKCPYCDFNSHPLKEGLPEKQYVEAVVKDLDQDLPQVWGRRVCSVFIGGGTPSILDPQSIDMLLSAIRARLICAPDMEITLEANPGSSDTSKFKDFRNAGVNRLSIGVQSFQDNLLRAIGRIHDGATARAAADAALAAGFDNFNLDLMYALPEQRLDNVIDDVLAAVSFSPSHISCYQLTVEPNTAFFKQPPQLPDDEIAWQMQTRVKDLLDQEGYHQYEISAYTRGGLACRHNMNYWRFGDYLGIGAGAHGKITQHDKVIRYWKVKHPKDYMNKAHSEERLGGYKTSTPQEIRFEYMLNAMRLQEPITAQHFQQHTGQAISTLKTELEKAHKDRLLNFDGKRILITPLGHRFLNDLLLRFLPEHEPRRACQY